MLPEIFSDEIGLVGFSNGVVRIDFASINSSTNPQSSNKMMTLRQRVVMPVEGFLRSLKTMQDLADKLEQQGVITKDQVEVEVQSVDSQPSVQADQDISSPNF